MDIKKIIEMYEKAEADCSYWADIALNHCKENDKELYKIAEDNCLKTRDTANTLYKFINKEV